MTSTLTIDSTRARTRGTAHNWILISAHVIPRRRLPYRQPQIMLGIVTRKKKPRGRVGRPPIANPRTVRVTIRLLPEEHRRLVAAAGERDLADFVRSVLARHLEGTKS